jgi:hypothetical protein
MKRRTKASVIALVGAVILIGVGYYGAVTVWRTGIINHDIRDRFRPGAKITEAELSIQLPDAVVQFYGSSRHQLSPAPLRPNEELRLYRFDRVRVDVWVWVDGPSRTITKGVICDLGAAIDKGEDIK